MKKRPVYHRKATIEGHEYGASVYRRYGGACYRIVYHDEKRPRRVYQTQDTCLLANAKKYISFT